ncbi:MAG: hypothetical protein ACXWV5_08885 [Flavitalea sp.]
MKRESHKWLWVTLSGICLLLVFFLILSSRLSLSRIPLPIYFFLLLIGAISTTAFLSGALKSKGAYEGNVMNGKLTLAGPVVIFLVIIGAGYKFRPQENSISQSLSIRFIPSDGSNQFTNSDRLFLFLPDETKVYGVDSTGRAIIPSINTAQEGKSIALRFNSGSYSFLNGTDTNIVLQEGFNTTILNIPLIRKDNKVIVTGIVTGGKNTTAIPGLKLVITDEQLQVQTDSAGKYSFQTEGPFGKTIPVQAWRSNKLIYNSYLILSPVMNIHIPGNL